MIKEKVKYTILLPLYKETALVPQLFKAMIDLNFPTEYLQILILLENDDWETFTAVKSLNLPKYFKKLIIPPYGPRTKAKACNYGLMYAVGDYLVIYDAEDIPNPNQLMLALDKFNTSPNRRLACVQARLTFYNDSQNLLTRFCTIEYAILFNYIWPKFIARNIPLPLGGTSNHFKVSALKEINGWDEYNVTEDADIAYRLLNYNYSISCIDSYTLEESVSDIKSWIKQRSRWSKGHIITFLVHARNLGLTTPRVQKFKFLFSLYYFLGLNTILLILAPISVIMLIADLVWQTEFYRGCNIFIIILGLISAFFCNFILPIIVMGERKNMHILSCILYQVYLLLYIPVTYLALYQVLFTPYYWDKTMHKHSHKP